MPAVLTLLVPDLLPPARFLKSLTAAPTLERLLGQASPSWSTGSEFEDWLRGAWRIATVPGAALRRLAQHEPLVAHREICADPVYLRAERDHVQLFDAHHFELSAEEADGLIATLNQHFAVDGITLRALAPARWLAQLARDNVEATPTVPPWRAQAGSLFDHLRRPQSAAGIDWRALGNEAQMLLFEHPINLARESRGELPVNGVWFWGQDPLPPQSPPPFDRVWGTDEITCGLARFGESTLLPTPAGFVDLQVDGQPGLVVLDGLAHALRSNQPDAWLAELARLDAAWFAPVLDAVKAGELEGVVVAAPNASGTLAARLSAWDLWKFWRGPAPLAQLRPNG